MRKVILGLAAIGCVAGCATKPADGAAAVRITSAQDAAKSCRFLGQASSSAGAMPLEITRQNAVTGLQNKAVAMGGNLIVSAGPQITMPGPAANMNGDVYACP